MSELPAVENNGVVRLPCITGRRRRSDLLSQELTERILAAVVDVESDEVIGLAALLAPTDSVIIRQFQLRRHLPAKRCMRPPCPQRAARAGRTPTAPKDAN